MRYSNTTFAAIYRLFSVAVIRDLTQNDSSSLFARLLLDCGVKDCLRYGQDFNSKTLRLVYDDLFYFLLKSSCRDEYVYLSLLFDWLLLSKRKRQQQVLLTEFRVGESRADLVALNDGSTVFEIKSDRDTFKRLKSQIQDYKKVFTHCYVVVSANRIEEVDSLIGKEIGIIALKRSRFTIVRRACLDESYLSSVRILESLRLTEALELLRIIGAELPADVPNTLIRSYMADRVRQYHGKIVHDAMVKVLKKTRSQATDIPIIKQFPKSLQTLLLTSKIDRSDRDSLLAKLDNITLEEVSKW